VPLRGGQIEQTKAIQKFRSALGKFLAMSFRDLVNKRGRQQPDQLSAWDITKKEFVDAVVRVLEFDGLAKTAQAQSLWR